MIVYRFVGMLIHGQGLPTKATNITPPPPKKKQQKNKKQLWFHSNSLNGIKRVSTPMKNAHFKQKDTNAL